MLMIIERRLHTLLDYVKKRLIVSYCSSVKIRKKELNLRNFKEKILL